MSKTFEALTDDFNVKSDKAYWVAKAEEGIVKRITAIKAGLVYAGDDADGEPEFIGTDEQWTKYEQLLANKE